MKYIVKPVGSPAEVISQSGKLEGKTINALVGGYFECPYVPVLAEAGVTIWANESGLLEQLTPNLGLIVNGYPMIFVGPLVFTSSDQHGNTRGLAKHQIETVEAFCALGREHLLPTILLAKVQR